MKSKRKIFTISFIIVTLLIAFTAGYLLKPPVIEKVFLEKPGKHFFADELIFVANDGEKDVIIHLDLNRKELEEGIYMHYYWAQLAYSDLVSKDYVYFEDEHPQVSTQMNTQKLFTHFEAKNFEDLSSRENYSLAFTLGDYDVEVDLANLEGDFLIKNSLEYTKYISEGVATITVDGQRYEGRGLVSKIYSSDYSKYIFFDGYENIQNVTHNFMVWDAEGNFYALDLTEVMNDNPYYTSHHWILFKNAQTAARNKAFRAEIVFEKETNGTPKSWHVTVPQLNQDFQLQPAIVWNNENQRFEGVVQGLVEDDDTKSEIKGIFTYLGL